MNNQEKITVELSVTTAKELLDVLKNALGSEDEEPNAENKNLKHNELAPNRLP
jgi:hypothetical protein